MPIQATRTKPERGRFKLGRFKIGRFTPARTRTRRAVPIVRTPQPPVSVTNERLPPSGEPAHPVPVLAITLAEDHSPAARAHRARRKLARRYAQAIRAAKGKARLSRVDEYELLRVAYAAVRCWREDGVAEEIERELRAQADGAISRGSSLFLVLLRSALPRLNAKRASKWGAALELAAHHDTRSKRLVSVMRASGGIEGAARERAKLRAQERA
jgi:hypothetical protein